MNTLNLMLLEWQTVKKVLKWPLEGKVLKWKLEGKVCYKHSHLAWRGFHNPDSLLEQVDTVSSMGCKNLKKPRLITETGLLKLQHLILQQYSVLSPSHQQELGKEMLGHLLQPHLHCHCLLSEAYPFLGFQQFRSKLEKHLRDDQIHNTDAFSNIFPSLSMYLAMVFE